MEHVCVFQWESGALIYKTKLSNLCIGTRLLEPNVALATPLYVVMAVH